MFYTISVGRIVGTLKSIHAVSLEGPCFCSKSRGSWHLAILSSFLHSSPKSTVISGFINISFRFLNCCCFNNAFTKPFKNTFENSPKFYYALNLPNVPFDKTRNRGTGRALVTIKRRKNNCEIVNELEWSLPEASSWSNSVRPFLLWSVVRGNGLMVPQQGVTKRGIVSIERPSIGYDDRTC